MGNHGHQFMHQRIQTLIATTLTALGASGCAGLDKEAFGSSRQQALPPSPTPLEAKAYRLESDLSPQDRRRYEQLQNDFYKAQEAQARAQGRTSKSVWNLGAAAIGGDHGKTSAAAGKWGQAMSIQGSAGDIVVLHARRVEAFERAHGLMPTVVVQERR